MDFTPQDSDFFTFIDSNSHSDISKLRLKYHGKNLNFNLSLALLQIECRKKCNSKLKMFIANGKTLFPSLVASEQASHEAVASFHASVASGNKTILDMTAGLGIDSFAFASVAEEVVSCEIDIDKASMLEYNIRTLGINNINVRCIDSLDYISRGDRRFDMIFVDPARRGLQNSRVYNFRDCQPDIISEMRMLLSKAKTVMIKASPLLDISQTLRDIPYVRTIRAISVKGECKEILIEASFCDKAKEADSITAEAIDLNNDGSINSRFTFFKIRTDNDLSALPGNSPEVRYATPDDLLPGKYLYEPNASMMKLAPWYELSGRYPSLKKAAPSSHLFVSDSIIPDFPGRSLVITEIPDKKRLKSLKGHHINVSTRNYPLPASDLRKKLGVLEGDDIFLYATRLSADQPITLLAKKI